MSGAYKRHANHYMSLTIDSQWWLGSQENKAQHKAAHRETGSSLQWWVSVFTFSTVLLSVILSCSDHKQDTMWCQYTVMANTRSRSAAAAARCRCQPAQHEDVTTGPKLINAGQIHSSHMGMLRSLGFKWPLTARLTTQGFLLNFPWIKHPNQPFYFTTHSLPSGCTKLANLWPHPQDVGGARPMANNSAQMMQQISAWLLQVLPTTIRWCNNYSLLPVSSAKWNDKNIINESHTYMAHMQTHSLHRLLLTRRDPMWGGTSTVNCIQSIIH